MIYRFSCPLCKRKVSGKEVYPLSKEYRKSDSGEEFKVITRAIHHPGCVGVGELDIEYLDQSPQTKLFEKKEQ